MKTKKDLYLAILNQILDGVYPSISDGLIGDVLSSQEDRAKNLLIGLTNNSLRALALYLSNVSDVNEDLGAESIMKMQKLIQFLATDNQFIVDAIKENMANGEYRKDMEISTHMFDRWSIRMALESMIEGSNYPGLNLEWDMAVLFAQINSADFLPRFQQSLSPEKFNSQLQRKGFLDSLVNRRVTGLNGEIGFSAAYQQEILSARNATSSQHSDSAVPINIADVAREALRSLNFGQQVQTVTQNSSVSRPRKSKVKKPAQPTGPVPVDERPLEDLLKLIGDNSKSTPKKSKPKKKTATTAATAEPVLEEKNMGGLILNPTEILPAPSLSEIQSQEALHKAKQGAVGEMAQLPKLSNGVVDEPYLVSTSIESEYRSESEKLFYSEVISSAEPQMNQLLQEIASMKAELEGRSAELQKVLMGFVIKSQENDELKKQKKDLQEQEEYFVIQLKQVAEQNTHLQQMVDSYRQAFASNNKDALELWDLREKFPKLQADFAKLTSDYDQLVNFFEVDNVGKTEKKARFAEPKTTGASAPSVSPNPKAGEVGILKIGDGLGSKRQ